MNVARPLALAALALSLLGCTPHPRGARSASPAPAPPATPPAGEVADRPFRAGTPAEQARVAAAVDALATAEGDAFLARVRELVAAGELAVPALLDALGSPSVRVRSQAAYVLGVAKDRRTIDALVAAATLDASSVVRGEAAASLLSMGDPRGLAPLVDALEDPDPRLRVRAIDVLAESTGQRLGYEPDGPPSERTAAVRRWRAWLEARRAPCPVPSPEPPPDTPEAKPAR